MPPPAAPRRGAAGVGALPAPPGAAPPWAAAWAASVADPATFWGAAADAVAWDTLPSTILDNSRDPFPSWFRGGVLNGCYNAVDRHVEAGAAARPAIVFHSGVTGARRVMTYGALLEEVQAVAAALVRLGVRRGDAVLLYAPSSEAALATMLACGRLGAVHSVVFGGFAPH